MGVDNPIRKVFLVLRVRKLEIEGRKEARSTMASLVLRTIRLWRKYTDGGKKMISKKGRAVRWGLAVTLIGISLFFVASIIGIAAEKTIITVWSAKNFGSVDAIIETHAAEYEKANPDVDIQVKLFPWGAYWDKLLASIAAGTGPDVSYLMHPTMLGPYIEGDALLPFPDEEFHIAERWHPSAAEPWKFDDKYYGLQYQFNPTILFYNKDLFKTAGLDPDRPPQTWKELTEYAQKLTLRNQAGKMLQSGFGVNIGEEGIWSNLIFVQGGNVVTLDSEVAFDSPEALKALELMRDLVFKYQVNNRQFAGWGEGFELGRMAMVMLFATYGDQIQQQFPDINFGTGPVPAPEAGMNDRSVMYGDWGLIISKQASDRGSIVERAAYEFAKSASSTEQHERILMAGATAGPVRYDVLENEPLIKEFLEKYPEYKPVVEKIPYTEYGGKTPYWARVQQEAINPMFDRIFLLRWPAEKALKACVETAEQVLAEWK